MSIVLGIVEERSRRGRRGGFSQAPVLRVQCGTCGRIYVTSAYPSRIKAYRYCAACVPSEAHRRAAIAGWITRRLQKHT